MIWYLEHWVLILTVAAVVDGITWGIVGVVLWRRKRAWK